MENSALEPAFPAGITRESVLAQMLRILSSGVFAESQRMSRFLRFTVGEAVKGGGARLKEIVIGAEVFDRGLTYDPRIDPIVRVEARRLRSKLHSYYEGPGNADRILIEFPKGSYAPVFSLRAGGPFLCAPSPEPETIAVLPFANLNGDSGTRCFSDGITEEIIHALTRVPGIRVMVWSTTVNGWEREDDLPAAARQFGVSHLLRGSVRASASRTATGLSAQTLRIAARLIASSGEVVWSQRWDREMHDIFRLQEEIALAIAAALKVKFQKVVRPAAERGIVRKITRD
jgi:serine/threonine-protein kinase